MWCWWCQLVVMYQKVDFSRGSNILSIQRCLTGAVCDADVLSKRPWCSCCRWWLGSRRWCRQVLGSMMNQIVVVSTWSKDFGILEMSPMQLCLFLMGMMGGVMNLALMFREMVRWSQNVGWHEEKKVDVMPVSKFCDRKCVTAPTNSPLHIFKGYISDDAPMKNQKISDLKLFSQVYYFQTS